MKIGLDYDGTASLDHTFWKAFIYTARSAGHEVFLVTMRREDEPIDWNFQQHCGLVYYTSRKAKKPFMERQGIQIDVWIDDQPHWVNQDSA